MYRKHNTSCVSLVTPHGAGVCLERLLVSVRHGVRRTLFPNAGTIKDEDLR